MHELFVKFITGKRRWDHTKYPDFSLYFCLLIKSHIDNLCGKEQHCIKQSEEFFERCVDACEEFSPTTYLLEDQNDSFLERCVHQLETDIFLVLIFLDMTDGMRNKEISKEIHQSVPYVENAKKRIQRKLHPLFEEFYEKKIELRV